MASNKRIPQAMVFKPKGSSPLEFNPVQYKPFLKLFKLDDNGCWVWNGQNLCIFDEVGVGKTIEAGIILRELMPYGEPSDLKVLILCPVKLISNWKSELEEKFGISPINYREDKQFGRITLLPYSYFTYNSSGFGSNLNDEIKSEETDKKTDNGELSTEVTDKIKAVPEFDILIADEAHYLRNPESTRHQAVAKLLEKHTRNSPLIFMTGTPIVNETEDMTILHDLISEGDKVQLGQTQSLQCVANCTDIIPEINLLEIEPSDIMTAIFGLFPGGAFEKRIPVSSMYSAYKHFDKVLSSNDATSIQKENAQRRIAEIKELLGVKNEKELSAQDFEGCDTKFDGFWESLEAEFGKIGKESEKKAIVFCHYTETLNYLKKRLENNGIRLFVISGDTSYENIAGIKSEFAACSDSAVLLCSDAAKEGHNLQFCHLMYHYDYAFTATDLAQRIGRIYRKGQTENPRVFYVHVNGSYDDRMLDIVLYKAQLTEESKVVPLSSFVPAGKVKPKGNAEPENINFAEVRRNSFVYRYEELMAELTDEQQKETFMKSEEKYKSLSGTYIGKVYEQPFLNDFYLNRTESELGKCVMFRVLEEFRARLITAIGQEPGKQTIVTEKAFYTPEILNMLFSEDAGKTLSRDEIRKRNEEAYAKEYAEVVKALFDVVDPESFSLDEYLEQSSPVGLDSNNEGEDF